MHDIEIYIPVLLKFINDTIVFNQKELACMKGILDKSFVPNPSFKNNCQTSFEHCLRDEDFQAFEQMFLDEYGVKPHDLKLELYYYHHRVIFRYTCSFKGKGLSAREVRSLINRHYKHVLNDVIIKQINNYVDEKKVRDEGRVLSYYSYLLMICNSKKYSLKNLSDKLGSLTFKIVQSSKNTYRYAHYHYVRISIPSTIVYADQKIDVDLKVDLINSIYQYCLYKKKQEDEAHFKGQTDFKEELVDQYNVINEGMLTYLWEYLMDSLGGKTSDNQVHEISKKNFYYSIGAFLIAILSVAISVYNM